MRSKTIIYRPYDKQQKHYISDEHYFVDIHGKTNKYNETSKMR